jgi:hypothetical protein
MEPKVKKLRADGGEKRAPGVARSLGWARTPPDEEASRR